MVGSGRKEVITSKGCSRLFSDITCTLGASSFRDLQPSHSSSSPATNSTSLLRSTSNFPFSGLVICITGLSKEARKQVMDATERLGGEFSPNLHPRCTHLVIESSHGRNIDYALKHGAADGLFIVKLGWFVDCVRKNVRLNESLYGIKSLEENYKPKEENAKQSNLIEKSRLHSLEETKRRRGSIFSGQTFYVDAEISTDLRNKVVEAAFGEGALLAGHNATHVVCEGSSVRKYLSHSNNIVTPIWVLKTAKETRPQRLVHLSADLARHVGLTLHNLPGGTDRKVCSKTHEENQSIAILAKKGVRNRRMQMSQKPIKISTRSILLGSICWSISEPSSTASIYTDSFSFDVFVDAKENMTKPDSSFVNFSRPLSESEKNELVLENHFVTILFPVDRFAEMGPCSRTFFSDTGFTCSQLLDHIYAFYQENMSRSEIELAIHTDTRHANRLRSVYSSKEAAERGYVELKRIDFVGNRKIFEMLKRVPGDNNNVYELLTRA